MDISTRYTYVYCIRSELFIKYKVKLEPASPDMSCFSRFVTFRIIPSNMHLFASKKSNPNMAFEVNEPTIRIGQRKASPANVSSTVETPHT